MMNKQLYNKKNKFLSLILICSLYVGGHEYIVYAASNHTTQDMRYFDAYNSDLAEFEDEYLLDNDDFFNTEVPLRSVDPVLIMQLLVGINAPAILQIPLYKHTNILNDRDLLDMPLFEPRGCLSCIQRQDKCCTRSDIRNTFDVSLFYNQTSRCFFTKDSSDLDCYLALNEPSLIQLLEENIAPLIPLFSSQEIPIRELAAIFGRMTTQERRAGLMFHGIKEWPCGMVRMMIPFYYRERNFFLDDKLKKRVEEIFEPGDPVEQDKFQRQHFISDELGIGDTRVEGFYQLFNKPALAVSIGGLLTLPTATTFVRGLRGRASNFPKSCAQPTFSIEELFCLANGPITPEKIAEAFAEVSNFLLGALDRLAANLLDTKLGNDGHVGLGLVLLYTSALSSWLDYCWTQRIFFRGRASAEYLIPKTERRMFLRKIDYAGFATRDFSSMDEQTAADNLLFLQNELINKLYLFGFNATIRPGMILRLTSKICYEGDCWGAFAASDWWIQTKEHIRTIHACPNVITNLDLAKARLPYAIQYKLVGGFDYTLHRPCCDISLGLGADATVWSSGIGKDFTLQARCTVLF